jgi:hypothetical protein
LVRAARGGQILRVSSRVERFLAHLDEISGGLEPRFFPIDVGQPGTPRVTVISYEDVPEPGFLTAITYGLSLADHDEWRLGRPELCISVRSRDPAWGLAVGTLASSLRGRCPFRYGDTIGFGQPVTAESAMTSFVVFAPAILDREAYANIDVSDPGREHRDLINIAGMYPIHECERAYIGDKGLEAFWKLDWDPNDVSRPSVC